MRQTTATTFTCRLLLLLSVGASASSALWAQDPTIPPEFKALQGSYMLYGHGLGDPQPASPKDSKIAFSVESDAARRMFESMGPDVRDICTGGAGIRVRTKGNISCQHEKQGEYHCSFGFDLRTGKSIPGSTC